MYQEEDTHRPKALFVKHTLSGCSMYIFMQVGVVTSPSETDLITVSRVMTVAFVYKIYENKPLEKI